MLTFAHSIGRKFTNAFTHLEEEMYKLLVRPALEGNQQQRIVLTIHSPIHQKRFVANFLGRTVFVGP